MSNINWIPVAISEEDYQNPAILLNMANILCDVFGYPRTDEARAKANSRFPLIKIENVIGNVDEGVSAG